MTRRVLSLFLLVLLTVVLLPPLLMGCYHRVALERYKAALRAAGHLKTLAEARPRSLADVVNGGPALTNLAQRLPSLPSAMQPGMAKGLGLPAGTRRVNWAQPELPSDEQTNLWPDLRVLLGTHAADIAALRSALEAPVLEFPVRYEDGFRVLLPHFTKMKVIVQLLSADAELQLHDGQPELALADTIAGVHLAARWNREPILLSQFMRIAIAKIMVNTTWEVLQFQDWNDADLAALQQAWLELDLPASMDATLDFEEAEMVDLLGHLSRKQYAGLFPATSGSEGAGMDSFFEIFKLCCRDPKEGLNAAWDRYPRWWAFRMWRHYQLEKVALQRIEAARASLRAAVEHGAWLARLREVETNVTRLDGLITWAPDFINSGSSYTNLMAKYAGIEAQRSLVLAAIALERHQHKHGSYPDSLKQLVPEFLAALPRDPMNGQTLRYRRKDDGSYTLYSVGRNGEDDGGDPTPLGTLSYGENGKDIVWPKAASQAEVDAAHGSFIK